MQNPILKYWQSSIISEKPQSRAKSMKHCQEIKQNWTGRETLMTAFV